MIEYDGDYFDLHKPSDIRSLVTVIKYVTGENEQLKKDCTVLIYHNQDYRKENEQLKQELLEYCNFSLHDVLDKKNKEIEQLKVDKQSLIDFIRKEFPKSHKHILEGFE